MSWEAMVWAIQQKAPTSSAKFVLVGLGNCAAPEDWHAWPSVAYLSDCTQQDRKTVLGNLGRLEQAGLIHRAGNAGRTNQVTKWRLSIPAGWLPSGPVATSTKNGTGTKNGTVPLFPANSTKNGTATSTKNGTRNHKGNHKGNKSVRELRKNAEHPLFAAFYAAYPRKAARPAALKAFTALNPDADTLNAMLAGIDAQGLAQRCASSDTARFVPHPASWINGRRWEDPATAPAATVPAPARPVLHADHVFTGEPE